MPNEDKIEEKTLEGVELPHPDGSGDTIKCKITYTKYTTEWTETHGEKMLEVDFEDVLVECEEELTSDEEDTLHDSAVDYLNENYDKV